MHLTFFKKKVFCEEDVDVCFSLSPLSFLFISKVHVFACRRRKHPRKEGRRSGHHHLQDKYGNGYWYIQYVTNSPHPLRFFVNSRTLMGCTDPLRRGIGAHKQCPLGSVASYLCYMLTFAHYEDSSHSSKVQLRTYTCSTSAVRVQTRLQQRVSDHAHPDVRACVRACVRDHVFGA